MERLEKAARLRTMLLQVTEGKSLETIAQPAEEEPAGERDDRLKPQQDLNVSLSYLQDGHEDRLSSDDLFAIEAIVMPQQRPVVFVRNGKYDDIGQPWAHLNDSRVRSRLTPLLRSIGRVEVPSAPWLPFGGSGFIVGTNLLMTNRHVAKLFTEGVGIGTRLQYQPGDAAVDFKREVDIPSDNRSAYLNVRQVIMIHPFWDMALLRVEGAESYTPLSLSVNSPEDLVGREVIAVGYPARDDRNDLALQDRIFEKQYNVKRVQPGKLRPRATFRSFDNVVNALVHDSSTLGGNSGSAIIDVQSATVVGLHFAGEYLKANYAVPSFELARDRRVVQAKLNFAGSLMPTNEWDSAWLSAGVDTAAAQVSTVQPAAFVRGGMPGPSRSLIVNIPVCITVSIPDTQPVPVDSDENLVGESENPTGGEPHSGSKSNHSGAKPYTATKPYTGN